MEPTSLQEFLGEPAQFRLRLPNRTFHLRVFTVGDSKWIIDKFGSDFDMNNIVPTDLFKIVYQLLEDEDKEFFKSKEVSFWNDDGQKLTKIIGGAELMLWQVSGLNEMKSIKDAVLTSLSGSQAVAIANTEEKKKEHLLEPQTGPKSATSSPPNMDGPQAKSFHARTEKSRTGSKQLQNGKSSN